MPSRGALSIGCFARKDNMLIKLLYRFLFLMERSILVMFFLNLHQISVGNKGDCIWANALVGLSGRDTLNL